ncbi:hypothetical protein [Negadavirga shengliensis]|uniref:SPOR domain-containing protein n=1 Tax=Negadavirga shengliensis TaxID=1389218 RepID=A0ABV9SY56_9BACT
MRLSDIWSKSALYAYPFLVLFLISLPTSAKNDPAEEFDEILIYVQLSKFGGTELPAAIRDTQLYLSFTDLFDYLMIKYEIAEDNNIKGFIRNEEDTYHLNLSDLVLSYKNQLIDLSQEALIQEDGFIYLNSSYFGEVFGLHCTFNFRDLSVLLETDIDLPVIKVMRQEMIRKNLNKLNKVIDPDTIISPQRSVFKLTSLDYDLALNRQYTNGRGEQAGQIHVFNQNRAFIGLGGELAGGEFSGQIRHFQGTPLRHVNLHYQWRHVNNDNKGLRQVTLGRLIPNAASTIFSPVSGVQVTNASTLLRKSFGTYRIENHTEPDWTVELYVNNVLIDFTTADAAGFYSFDVPLNYGNTTIQLRFYGLHGEEHFTDQQINIPFNLVRAKEFIYNVSGGYVDDGVGNYFSRIDVNYGLTNFATIGGGMEYFTAITSQPFMPFVNSSLKVWDGFLVSGEFMPGVRTKGSLNYRVPSGASLDMKYTKLEKNQQAIIFNYLEERKASLSIPFHNGKTSIFNRLSVTQTVFEFSTFTNAQWMISSRILGIPTNISAIANIFNGNIFTYSTFSQTYRLPKRISLMPQVQYNYNQNMVSNALIRIEKPISKQFHLNAFYQHNAMSKNNIFGIGFRYDLGFANGNTTTRASSKDLVLSQLLRGSILFDHNTHHFEFNNQVNVGKAAMTILPFLDVNGNGIRDEDEPLVHGLKVKIRGGSMKIDKKSGAIRVFNLIPYETYIIEVDPFSLENIAWRIKDPAIQIKVFPNSFNKVEIPVRVENEVAGTVMVGNSKKTIGGIKIIVYDEQNHPVHTTVSEYDGYFSIMGVAPGSYVLRPDSVQLQKLGYQSTEIPGKFEVKLTEEGEYIDGLDILIEEIIQKRPLGDSETPAKQKPGVHEDEITNADEANAESKKDMDRSTATQKGDATDHLIEERTNTPVPVISHEAPGLKNDRLSLKPPPETLDSAKRELGIVKVITSENALTQPVVADPKSTPADESEGEMAEHAQDNQTVYKIQILATLNKPTSPVTIAALEKPEVRLENGWYKHFYGHFDSYESAQDALQAVKAKGFPDAFVVHFKDGGEDDIHLPGKDTPQPDQVHYKIQVLANRIPLPTNHRYFRDLEDISLEYQNGLYKYTLKTKFTYKEAEKKLKHLRENGFKDAFITKYKGYKRIAP